MNLVTPRTWLVEGEVLSITPLPDVVIDTENKRMAVRITHVYSGPSFLQDKTMEHLVPEQKFSSFPIEPNPYKKGQCLLFAVQWGFNNNQESDIGRLTVFPAYSIGRPIILDGSERTHAIEAHAKRIERLYNAKPEEWKTIIEEYARGQFPITTLWAIVTISNWPNREEKYKLLTSLIELTDRSARQLNTIERQLVARGGGERWQNSLERASLLSKVVRIPQEDGGQETYMMLVDSSSYRGVTTPTRFLSNLSDLIDNPTTSSEVRQLLMKLPSRLVKSDYGNKIDKSTAFDFWMGLLNNPKNFTLVEAVATEIAANAPWTLGQNQELKTIVASLQTQKYNDSKAFLKRVGFMCCIQP